MRVKYSRLLAALLTVMLIGSLVVPPGFGVREAKAAPAKVWEPINVIYGGSTGETATAVDANGAIYTVYQDVSNRGKISVKKQVDGAWELVGKEGFTSAYNLSLAVQDNDSPYIALQDGYSLNANVMHYNQESKDWEQLSTDGMPSELPSETPNGLIVALDADGAPLLLYQTVYSSDISVLRFDADADSWATLGTDASASISDAKPAGLYVEDGTIYRAYYKSGNLAVEWYDEVAQTWNSAAALSSDDFIMPINFAVDQDVIYLSYLTYMMDTGTLYSKVIEYKSGQWKEIGEFTTSDEKATMYAEGGVLYIAAAFESQGLKVMAYKDEEWVQMGSYTSGVVSSSSLYFQNGDPYLVVTENSGVVLKTLLYAPPTLTADGTDNDSLHDIVITFDNDTDWLDAITGVTVEGTALAKEYYEVEDGKLTIDPGTLPLGDNTVVVTATGYAKATVKQWIIGKEPPRLRSGMPNPSLGQPVVITFEDDEQWRAAVWGVYTDKRLEAGVDYTLSPGKLTIAAGVLPAGVTGIEVDAENYWSAHIDQPVLEASDSTSSWRPVGSPTVSDGEVGSSSVYVSGGVPYVAYVDYADGRKVAVKKLEQGGWSNVGSAASEGGATLVSLAIDGGVPYVAYLDRKITVRKYVGEQWTSVGREDVAQSEGSIFHFAFQVKNGIPYVSYVERGDDRVHVMRMNDNDWEDMGEVGVAYSEFTNLFVDGDNIPYVAYYEQAESESESESNAVVVKRWNEQNRAWEMVGDPMEGSYPDAGFSLFVSEGTPYLAYADTENEGRAAVKNWSGRQWESVGELGISAGRSNMMLLRIDGGVPYAAFTDESYHDRVLVKRFDGDRWTIVGDAAHHANLNDRLFSFEVSGGTPYLSYADASYDDRGVVTAALSTDNRLSGLGLSAGTLSPAFDPATKSYTVDVPSEVSSLSVAPTAAAGDRAVVKVNGAPVPSGGDSGDIPLNTGENPIVVEVTSQHGVANEYSIRVARAPSANANLGGMSTDQGAWAPTFSPERFTYTVTVPGSVTTVDLFLTKGEPNQSFSVTGAVYQSVTGDVYGYRASGLAVGNNPIGVTVAAADGTTNTYGVTIVREGNGNADLSSLSLTQGTLAPAFEAGLTSYRATVGSTIDSVAVIPTSADANATEITVGANGGAAIAVASGQASSAIALRTGENAIEIVVTAENGAKKTYTVIVTREAAAPGNPGNGNGGGPVVTPSTPNVPAAPGSANSDVSGVGTVATEVVNGRSVATVTLDARKLEERLAAEGRGAVIALRVSAEADVVVGALSGSMLRSMEQAEAALSLQTADAGYSLPAKLLKVQALANIFGQDVALEDVNIEIEIAAPTTEMMSIVEIAAAGGRLLFVAPPVSFKVRATYGDTSIEISKFDTYVERFIAIPEGVDPATVTTGVVVDEKGGVRPIPTKIVEENGRYVAKMNSLTNSVYALISNAVRFEDMEGHWAEATVIDMGARMIVQGSGDGKFDPDRNISRAEFAALLVRGLGLGASEYDGGFTDVAGKEWYSGVVQTAYEYGLISGFEDGSFHPNEMLTREQAMRIISDAMKLTGLAARLTERPAEDVLQAYGDASEIAPWALSGIASSVQAGIVSGRDGGKLAPKAYMTRAEVAAIIQRLLSESDLL
ncbi:cadherin-like beta sandwich domain-containing protein [Cohnella cholangitidis]|nr:cadherin-like beta sandwich domain-containing protein [Cohnella cholangitidis]